MRRSGKGILFSLILLGACSDKGETTRPPQDLDGDGYTDLEECNDEDAAISPAADELCDGVDNNCDGVVDDDAIDAETWYPDNDGDGFGSDTVPGRVACEDPSSSSTTYSTDPNDCDDGDLGVNPTAAEDCSDGVDNDCDEVTDACTDNTQVVLGDAQAKVLGEEGESAGTSIAGPGDVDGDGMDDLVTGAPLAEEDGDARGAVYLVLGGSVGEVASGLSAARLLGELQDDLAGTAVSGGDVDNDGYADILVGAPGDDTTESNAGAAYLELGPVTGERSLGRADAKLTGTAGSDALGSALAVVGSVGGDAGADLWVGEPWYGDGLGRAYLVLGPPSGEVEIRTQDGRLQGEVAGDKLGSAVGDAGDMDGNGKSDLVVGAPGSSVTGTRAGRVYLALDDLRGAVSAADADAVLDGEGEGDQAGVSVAGVGDLDGDGYSEVLVGAYGDDENGADAGVAYLLAGTTRGAGSLSGAQARLLGPEAGSYAGFSVAGPGDVNGDGAPDLLIGVPYDETGGEAAGAAYVVYGPVSGAFDLGGADAEIIGEDSTDQAGRVVAGGGDADGDGLMDVIVSSPLDDDGGTDAGAAWLVLGAKL